MQRGKVQTNDHAIQTEGERQVRILMLTQFYPPVVGGQERHVKTLSTALAGRGHQVDVLTIATDPAEVGVAEESGVWVHRVATTAQRAPALYREAQRPHALPIPDPALWQSISRLLHGGRPYDVLHAHDWAVNSALGPARRTRTPIVLTMHDYGHVCATKRLMRGDEICPGPQFAACVQCAGRKHKSKLGPGVAVANMATRPWRERAVATFLPVSSAVAERTGLRPGTFEVIPNFIPDASVTEVASHVEGGPIVFVGDLSLDKGVGILLDAYRLLSNPPPMVLAGRTFEDVPLHLPPNVELAGVIDHAEVERLMASATVVVVPSIVPDCCPTVVLEAMAAGRPVIASSSGGIVDLVVDGVTGLLVSSGDVEALAGALSQVLSNSRLRRAMSESAVSHVARFTSSSVVSQIEAVYERVCGPSLRRVP